MAVRRGFVRVKLCGDWTDIHSTRTACVTDVLRNVFYVFWKKRTDR